MEEISAQGISARSGLRALCDLTETVCRVLIGAAVAAIVAITVGAVWFRYVLEAPLSWTEQVSGMVFVWITFLGTAVLYRRMLHIAIDMIVLMLPVAAQKLVYWLNQVLVLVLALMMIWFGGQHAIANMPQTFGALEISPSWFYFAAPVAGALIVLYWIEKLFDPRFRVPDGEVHL